MSGDREETIKSRAYEIWQREGSQHGRDREHWEEAARQLGDGQDTPGAPGESVAATQNPAAEAPAAEVPPADSPDAEEPTTTKPAAPAKQNAIGRLMGSGQSDRAAEPTRRKA